MRRSRSHPTLEEWVNYVEEGAPAPVRRRLETHLIAGCRTCDETVEWITRVRRTMLADRLADPPEWVVARAVDLCPGGSPRRGARTAKIPRRFLTTRVTDFGEAALVIRETVDRPASLVARYRTGDCEFILEVSEEPGGTYGIRGRLVQMPDEERPPFVFVSVERGAEVEAAAPAGPLGDFEFTNIAPGAVRVLVEVDGDEFEIEPPVLG